MERRLFLEAAIRLGIARLMILTLPFRWYAPLLGTPMTESPHEPEIDKIPLITIIARQIKRAARMTPWQSTCLAQAMAAQQMLKRRGLPNTLYLGVARENESTLSAHAWLCCGSIILTGEREMAHFTMVSSFTGKEDLHNVRADGSNVM